MSLQLFAKGKEVTGVTSNLITSTSQYTNNGVSDIAISGLSLSGFTATLTDDVYIPAVFITFDDLIVGQVYDYTFQFTSTNLTFLLLGINLSGSTNPFVKGSYILFNIPSDMPLTHTGTFIATETSAQIYFWNTGNIESGGTFQVSNISVTGSTNGFNGEYELDVQKGSPFTLDLNFKDIKDLKSKGSHSYNFRLPSSPQNDSFFGSYFQVGSYYSDDNFSFNPFGMVECWVLKDSIEIFKGNLQLSNIYLKNKNSYEYECIIFSQEVGFADTIKGIKFKDLDFTEYNHQLSPENVYNSFNSNAIAGGKIRYSLYDYGIGHASNEYVNYFQQPSSYSILTSSAFNVTRLRPQIQLKALIDLVFDSVGYKYDSTFFGSADFLKIYQDLNYNKKDTIYTEVQNATYNTLVTNAGTQNVQNNQASIVNRIVEFDTESSDVTGQWNNTNNYWAAQTSGWYNVTISGTITPSGTPSVTTDNIAFQLFDNYLGTYASFLNTELVEWFDTLSVGSTAIDFSQTIQVYRNPATPSTNVYVGLWCGATGNNSVTWQLSNMSLEIEAQDLQSTSTNLVFINGLLGELSIEQWWKSLLTKFNLITIPNKHDNRLLKIEPYNDYIDTGNTYDWSDKIDYTKDVQIIPPTKYCGKQIRFKDTQSNDYVYQSFKRNPFDQTEPTYGEHIVPSVRNQFADKDTIFTSIFVPTINYPLNKSSMNLGVYTCAVWNVKDNGAKENTGGIRLSFFHGIKALPNNLEYALSNTDTFSGTSYNNYPFFSAYSEKDFTDGTNVWSLNWQETLQSPPQDWDSIPSYGLARKFWNNYISDNFNVNSRMLSAHIKLSARDLADFSFADTIQLMGQNYKVNSIKGFPVSSDGNSKIELLLTNKSLYLPTAPITTGGGIIVGENQIYCDFQFAYIEQTTDLLYFTTSEDSTPSASAITEECCTANGGEWRTSTPTGLQGCYFPSFPDLPDDTSSGMRNADGNQTNNNSNDLRGNANQSLGSRNNIIGTKNVIGNSSFNNNIDGDYNTLKYNITSTNVYGSYNDVLTEQAQYEAYGELLQYRTTIKGGTIKGDYGRLLITGDNIQSDGTSGYATGTNQSGIFTLNFDYDGDNPSQLIGQYGVFEMTDNYNSVANRNGFRFAGKTNITLNVLLSGTIQEATNQTYANKYILKQTIVISNYRNPIIIYSNVDSVVSDSAFGTTTLECYSLSKPPYYDLDVGSFIAFKLSNDARKDIKWSMKVSYETTPIQLLTNDAIANPLALTDCKLWLDAANQNSLSLSGDSVNQWNDISGQDNHVSQSSSTYKPTYNVDDWQRPYLDFDGTTAFLKSTSAGLLGLSQSSNTFIAVYKSDVTTAESFGQCIVGISDTSNVQRIGLRVNASSYGGGGADSVAFSSQTSFSNMNACNISSAGVTDLSIAIGTRSGTSVTIKDGNGNSDTATSGADDTTVNNFTVGASSGNGSTDYYEFNGKIYELVCYSRALTSDEIEKSIAYLKNKWSII